METRPNRYMELEAVRQNLIKAPVCACGNIATKILRMTGEPERKICDSCEREAEDAVRDALDGSHMKITRIEGDHTAYVIGSEGQEYLICLTHRGVYTCECKDWTCRSIAYKQKTGRNYECKHIKIVKKHIENQK